MTLFEREWGEGQPLIVLHPLALESTAFSGVAQLLARREVRTIAVNLPGFGRTPGPDAQLTPACMAEPVVELARSLATPPVVLGMSMGGRVALEAAPRDSRRIRVGRARRVDPGVACGGGRSVAPGRPSREGRVLGTFHERTPSPVLRVRGGFRRAVHARGVGFARASAQETRALRGRALPVRGVARSRASPEDIARVESSFGVTADDTVLAARQRTERCSSAVRSG